MEILAIIFLATFIEGMITYLFGEGEGRSYIRYIALALGVVVAVAYQIDIPAMVGLPSSVAGFVISGLVIGRGSNYVNDVLKMIQRV